MAADEGHEPAYYELDPSQLPYLAGTVLGHRRTADVIEPVTLVEQFSIDVDRDRALSRYTAMRSSLDSLHGVVTLAIIHGYYVVGAADVLVDPTSFQPVPEIIVCGQMPGGAQASR